VYSIFLKNIPDILGNLEGSGAGATNVVKPSPKSCQWSLGLSDNEGDDQGANNHGPDLNTLMGVDSRNNESTDGKFSTSRISNKIKESSFSL